jgi:hypothetical protein
VGEQPLGVALWGFKVGAVGGNVKFGDVSGFVVGVTEEVEGEVEEAWEIFPFADMLDVIVFDFEGLGVVLARFSTNTSITYSMLKVVKYQQPAEQISA